MKEELKRFAKIAGKLLDAEKEEGVVAPVPYEELDKYLNLELSDEGISDDVFEEALTALVLRTPRTQTKSFFNQLFAGRRDKAYLGELLAVLLNNSMYTYKVGGPMIRVEKLILNKISELIGFEGDTEGTIAPGGSITNYMAMLMARDRYDENARLTGIKKALVAYTSEESHYSVAKNAAFCGLGRDNVRVVESDMHGRMRIDILEKYIQEDIASGKKPFLINATAGTTVLGSFDDLEAIADLRDRYDVWMHVDAAYGGSVIFSEKYRHLVRGADRSDSFSINAHKMLATPVSCSIIITQHKECLYDSFSNEASYLYQGDQDEINPGKISIQCGRRNDALKFWALWKSIGTKGIADIVERQFAMADYARSYVEINSDYTLYSFENSVNICFNYKDVPAEELCAELYRKGRIMVGYGHFKNNSFVRLVSVNHGTDQTDYDAFFKQLELTAGEIIANRS